MFEAEARWLHGEIAAYPLERVSPLLNLGSGSAAYREEAQPWIETGLFAPLWTRGISTIHVDRREAPGVDVKADLADDGALRRLRELSPRALLCNNLLEHIVDPAVLARNCLSLVDRGGLLLAVFEKE